MCGKSDNFGAASCKRQDWSGEGASGWVVVGLGGGGVTWTDRQMDRSGSPSMARRLWGNLGSAGGWEG